MSRVDATALVTSNTAASSASCCNAARARRRIAVESCPASVATARYTARVTRSAVESIPSDCAGRNRAERLRLGLLVLSMSVSAYPFHEECTLRGQQCVLLHLSGDSRIYRELYG